MMDVKARLNGTYKSCSTQVNLPQDLAEAVMKYGRKRIEEKDVYQDDKGTCGLEDDIHVTVLYGLTEDDPRAVGRLLGRMARFDVRLGLVSAFMDNPDYDVVKIDVEAPELLLMHYLLKGHLPNTCKFPTYAPHCTVGYVKKGKAARLLGDQPFRGLTFDVSQVMFCGLNGSRYPIHLLP